MSCCAAVAGLGADAEPAGPSAEEVRLSSRLLGDGLLQTDLSVPAMHCADCMRTIERALAALDGVRSARVNLSTKRVRVAWTGEAVPPMVARLASLGYASHLADDPASAKDRTLSELILAVAVSGFATGNIMLLSVSVWAGADGATRDLFHWISALVAIPVIAFAGRIYFRSAWNALKNGRMNMDVPIAIGVSLAYLTSLYETITHGAHAYFDASVSLLFFLLIGRTLDHVMGDRARAAVSGLVRLSPRGAVRIGPDGARDYLPLPDIRPGMDLFIARGDRIPVNATVVEGVSDLDASLATGESAPQAIGPGNTVLAGTLNLTAPLVVRATAAASDSFLAEMVALMAAAEEGRGTYRRIADRASALYSPVVHLTALASFVGWMVATGDWHHSITVATAVLIITCPCALGLAVPIVQVVAARRLFEAGVMMKDGSALERLAEIDAVVFDKTGTLTTGHPVLAAASPAPAGTRGMALALSRASRHPFSRAITTAFAEEAPAGLALEATREFSGLGVEAAKDGSLWRLGRASWAAPSEAGEGGTVLSRDGVVMQRFDFVDALRPQAGEAVAALRGQGLPVEILSGDRATAVEAVAAALGIERLGAGVLPADKVARLAALKAEGRHPLMVGDGLNDAPAMMAAHVSMAPASAADIGRNAADFIFLHEGLAAVPFAHRIARQADRLIRQNFALAIGYNLIAVPIAILGHVTPLIAAIAMSGSSLIVIGNALRLGPMERATARRRIFRLPFRLPFRVRPVTP
ncbi:heavy metal translocating P-type ATPase [Ensifer soli]|uniref:heavy metal translocating P-type ATPase n=1 Tax=Ciceribacter sp. sgz301302 TaxID=3342379 RepID=UPI0035B98F3E